MNTQALKPLFENDESNLTQVISLVIKWIMRLEIKEAFFQNSTLNRFFWSCLSSVCQHMQQSLPSSLLTTGIKWIQSRYSLLNLIVQPYQLYYQKSVDKHDNLINFVCFDDADIQALEVNSFVCGYLNLIKGLLQLINEGYYKVNNDLVNEEEVILLLNSSQLHSICECLCLNTFTKQKINEKFNDFSRIRFNYQQILVYSTQDNFW